MIDLHGRAVRARIEQWREAGMIDAATADRLAAHEAAAGGASGFHAAFTLIGAGAVALGMAALVAANWDALPIWLKLGAHVAINLSLGVWAAAAVKRQPGGAGAEALLIVLSGSILAFIAHVGQSFQLQGDLFAPLATWLALTAPFTIALGRSLALRWLFTFGVAATLAAGAEIYVEALARAQLVGASAAALLAVAYAAPLAARGFAAAPLWGRHFNQLALGALAALTPFLAEIGWRIDIAAADPAHVLPEVIRGTVVACAGLALGGCGLWLRARRTADGALVGDWRFTLFVAASPAYAALPFLVGGGDSPMLAGLAYSAYWLAVGWFAHMAGSVGFYRLAVALVALRLFSAFIEAFGGLLMTGGGLVAVGTLLLGMGWAAQRYLRRRAAVQPETTP